MSSIATMYSFSRQFGLKYYVTQDQYDLLTYYFQPSTLDLAVVDVALANLSSLGVDLFKIKNKFALLWGEAQLCLPYVCL